MRNRWWVTVLLIGSFGLAGGARAAADTIPAPHYYPTVEHTEASRALATDSRRESAAALMAAPPPLVYHGGNLGIGVTTGHPAAYLVIWGSQWGAEIAPGSLQFTNDALGVARRVRDLLAGLGTNNERWSGVVTQYCEGIAAGSAICPASAPHVAYPDGGALAGVWVDTATPAPQSATAADIAAEAIRAAGHFGNTTPASNANTQYVVVSAKGTHPDGFNAGANFCAWHDAVNAGAFNPATPYGPIAFTNLPYIPDMGGSCGASFVNPDVAGLLDGVTMVEGHEFSETITDPTIGAWYDDFGDENADKCVWIGSGPGAAANVTFATGTFAMQTTWSNDSASCAMFHPVFGVDAQPDDFAIDLAPRTGTLQRGESIDLLLQAATVVGQTEALTLALSGAPPNSDVTLSADTLTSDDTATLHIGISAATPFGVYTIRVTATGPSTVHVATFVLTVAPPPVALENGVPVTGLHGFTGSNAFWKIDVPANVEVLDITTSGGTGDADLYVKRGALPSSTDYDCSSQDFGNLESCFRFVPEGTWYIRLYASSSYSDVTLQATYATPRRLLTGVLGLKDLSGAAGSRSYFWFSLPDGARTATISMTGATSDVDMYVRRLALPNAAVTLCPDIRRTGHRSERCRLKNPSGGTYFIGLFTQTDYTRLHLRAK